MRTVAPEGWSYIEIPDDEDPTDSMIGYACSKKCRDSLWKQGPGKLELVAEGKCPHCPAEYSTAQELASHVDACRMRQSFSFLEWLRTYINAPSGTLDELRARIIEHAEKSSAKVQQLRAEIVQHVNAREVANGALWTAEARLKGTTEAIPGIVAAATERLRAELVQKRPLTHEDLVIACTNIGVDITCGRCAGVFFTGSASEPHDPTCTTSRAADELIAEAHETLADVVIGLRAELAEANVALAGRRADSLLILERATAAERDRDKLRAELEEQRAARAALNVEIGQLEAAAIAELDEQKARIAALEASLSTEYQRGRTEERAAVITIVDEAMTSEKLKPGTRLAMAIVIRRIREQEPGMTDEEIDEVLDASRQKAAPKG
jgi:hypothetical protein